MAEQSKTIHPDEAQAESLLAQALLTHDDPVSKRGLYAYADKAYDPLALSTWFIVRFQINGEPANVVCVRTGTTLADAAHFGGHSVGSGHNIKVETITKDGIQL